jgi:hypothetical protein
MSKRFIDTGIYDDAWFMGLTKDAKLFWFYCITKCNHAGIIEINDKLCRLQTDIKSIESVVKELGNRLYCIKNGLYFVPKFIEFQYPGFPKSKVMQQQGALEMLCKYGLYDLENNCFATVIKELINSYDNGNVIVVNDSSNTVKNWRNDFQTYYDQASEAFMSASEDASFIAKLQEFHPNLNIDASLDASFMKFWGTKAGWANKKKYKTIDIDWRQTIANTITRNPVYKQKP